MTIITLIILLAFPLGMLLVTAGGFMPRHRVLIPAGGLLCSASMLPLGITLLSGAHGTMDYLMGGQAFAFGAILLVSALLELARRIAWALQVPKQA
jgi:hypothetical protein